MSKNPVINSLAAAAYIFLVVSVMTFGIKMTGKEDSFLAPVMALSVFTLSAAVMGYVFGYQPLTLFLDGKRKEGVKLFLQTVGCFAVITLIILILGFSKILG